MIHKEAWYQESVGQEAPYLALVEAWERSPKDDPEILEEILRMHRRLGRPPQEALRFVGGWEWGQLEGIPLELLPPVSFQVTFFIERYIDTDSSGVPGEGYISQKGEIHGDSPFLGKETSSIWLMSIPEFFQMLGGQGWSSWGLGSYLLEERNLYNKDLPTLELDSREGGDSKLGAFSKDLLHYRNNIIHHWTYSEWYDESEEELPEDYLNERGGWITTLQIHPSPQDVDYFEQVIEGAQESGAI